MPRGPKRHALYTWSAQRGHAPFPLGGGAGAWFWDRDGRRYLDFASVVVNANAGHNHPRILEAMRRQIDRHVVAGPFMETEVRERLARELARVTPSGVDQFLFTLGGADAVEHAVKMARLVTGRRKVICRARAYHGATFGALSFSDDPRAAPFRPGLPDVVRVKDPHCFRCPWGTAPDVCDRPCIAHVEETVLDEGPETIAAILMETVQGTTGGYFPPDEYYREVRALCDRHGILLILDEVLSGFGRTGTWFAIDHYGVSPDLMALGKGITSGHAPLGAVGVGERVSRFFEDNELATGTTHTAHPVPLSAALGNLEVLREQRLIDRSRELGESLRDELDRLRGRHAAVLDARSRGLYACLEIDERVDPARVRQAAWDEGLHLLARGGCLYLAPPLVISEADLARGLESLDRVLGRSAP